MIALKRVAFKQKDRFAISTSEICNAERVNFIAEAVNHSYKPAAVVAAVIVAIFEANAASAEATPDAENGFCEKPQKREQKNSLDRSFT